MSEELQCSVERITFQNKTNGFAIIKCQAQGYKDLVTALGTIPNVHVDGKFKFSGYWKNDAKWGMQFIVQSYEETLPTTTHGIEKYLASNLIKGIGPAYAKKIVEKFGEETLQILNTDIDRLSEIPGIGSKRLELIKQSWLEHHAKHSVMLFMHGYDLSTSLATKIYKYYGEDSIAVIKANPYRLTDELWGVGFKTADGIAKKLGLDTRSHERIRSGIIYVLKQETEAGNCFSYIDDLIEKSTELLEVSADLIVNSLDIMIHAQDVIQDDTAIYLPTYYKAEVGTANRLLTLLDSGRNIYIYFDEEEIRRTAMKKYVYYDDVQLNAIRAAVNNKVFVLTGGPGTGKTTTTQGIIEAYEQSGAKILLAAPTGRAAKRMSEVTGMEAKTIHRLIEMKPGEGCWRNEDNPLKGDVLIVDECSMIDILLMYALLKAIPNNMTLILVGDVDQLPSVGAGKVLTDILKSGVVPYIKLERIFRQAQRSKIITNAHKINKGMFPYVRDNDSDFKFFDVDEAEKAAELIISLCVDTLPTQYNIFPDEIQILTPMRRGAIGAANLNLMLQAALNPPNSKIKGMRKGEIEFRVNDKVMQIKNNYEKGVFNGDIGFITEIEVTEYYSYLAVSFEDQQVIYEQDELDEIVLAYASTIHKSQGSEFPYVIMPIMMSHFIMLQRNLLYTGVTRAKKGLILVGQTKAIYCAIKNDKIFERNTKLSRRLMQ